LSVRRPEMISELHRIVYFTRITRDTKSNSARKPFDPVHRGDVSAKPVSRHPPYDNNNVFDIAWYTIYIYILLLLLLQSIVIGSIDTKSDVVVVTRPAGRKDGIDPTREKTYVCPSDSGIFENVPASVRDITYTHIYVYIVYNTMYCSDDVEPEIVEVVKNLFINFLDFF